MILFFVHLKHITTFLSLAANLIPGCLYGNDKDGNVTKTLIMTDQKMLQMLLRTRGMSFENSLYEVVVKREVPTPPAEGTKPPKSSQVERPTQLEDVETALVVARDTQFHPGENIRTNVIRVVSIAC